MICSRHSSQAARRVCSAARRTRNPRTGRPTVREVGSMGRTVDDTALDTLFREARSYTKWQPRPVTDETVQALYDLLKWAPTSANASPARFAFLRSKEAKERLRPALAPLNVEKTMTAPVTVIVAYDMKFYEQLPKLFPQNPGMAKLFESSPEMVEATARRNSTLQGAYLIMAARALGLDCGPMSGFDHAKVDEEFFAAGDPSKLHPRLPRLPFAEACSLR